jgi:hypothetical protein
LVSRRFAGSVFRTVAVRAILLPPSIKLNTVHNIELRSNNQMWKTTDFSKRW